jgi:O-antigen ligase
LDGRARLAAALVSALPTAGLIGIAWALAWSKRGSIDAADWLGYAILAGLLLATVLAAGAAGRPSRRTVVALACILGLACWTAASLIWSPVPSLARDEALLTGQYAAALIVPALTLRSPQARLLAVAAVAAGSASIAVATAAHLRFGADPLAAYKNGRLYHFPISYGPAQAALFLLGFWPAIALAARRATPVVLRGLALGCAVADLAGWLLTQSRTGAVGLPVSALVVLAISRARLRLFVPAAIAGLFGAAAFSGLTAPFRHQDTRLEGAIRHAGATLIWLSAAAVVAGALYAFADRRLELSPRVRAFAGRTALLAAIAATALGGAVFFHHVDHPVGWAGARWAQFKQEPAAETGGSHFANPGSNRYDFWRVALHAFVRHPVAGVGGRSFGAEYLLLRRSGETPARAHSLELDLLMEVGLVGFALLAVGIGAPLLAAGRSSAAGGVVGTAALGGGAYWLVHATGDWIWTFPGVGIPFFVLLGIALAERTGPLLSRRVSALAAAVAILATAIAFVPPWLSARFASQALVPGAASATDLRWARRLDPISIDPYVTEYTLARAPAERIPPILHALVLEPRSAALWYLLGKTELAAGQKAKARRALEQALRLDPGEAVIKAALRLAHS